MQSSPTTSVFKNIVDSSDCTCGNIEDTNHFLLVCHQFTYLRRDLLNLVSDICPPDLYVLLCGDISLTFDQNKQIFKAVHGFILYQNISNTTIDAPISHCICE